jgi:TRAP-type C4-dicarboxylate transport system permease small subunit
MSRGVIRWLDPVRWLTALGAVALALMLGWTIVDIALRIVLKLPLHGTIDLVEATLVLVAFLAMPHCFRHDEQIKVDIFDSIVSARTLWALRLFGEAATLAFLVLLAVTLLPPLSDAYRFGDAKADIAIPIAALLAAIEFAIIVSCIVVSVRLVSLLRTVRNTSLIRTVGADPEKAA